MKISLKSYFKLVEKHCYDRKQGSQISWVDLPRPTVRGHHGRALTTPNEVLF